MSRDTSSEILRLIAETTPEEQRSATRAVLLRYERGELSGEETFDLLGALGLIAVDIANPKYYYSTYGKLTTRRPHRRRKGTANS